MMMIMKEIKILSLADVVDAATQTFVNKTCQVRLKKDPSFPHGKLLLNLGFAIFSF